jgi:hypothetical protein
MMTEFEQDQYVFPRKPDWQIVTIMFKFVDEVDCNSGRHRRVFSDGKIKYLD